MNLELAALHGSSRSPARRPGAAEETGSDSDAPSRVSDVVPASLRGDDIDEISAEELVSRAAAEYGRSLVLSSSFGADSALMLHLVSRVVPGIRVVLVDTGYLFPETYQFAEELKNRFDIELVVYGPQMTPARQEALYGRLWEQDEEGVRKYLYLNKVEPMQRALEELGVRAWIAGLRANQTAHRQGLARVATQDGRVKLHPILGWTKAQIDAYFAAHDLPRHPLYAQGYKSIGDWHSTIPVGDGDDDRAGRFLGAKKECGLHLSADENTSFSSSGL